MSNLVLGRGLTWYRCVILDKMGRDPTQLLGFDTIVVTIVCASCQHLAVLVLKPV